MADDVDMDAPQISTLREETTPEPNPARSKFRVKLLVGDKGESSKASSVSSKRGRGDSEDDEDEDDDDDEEEDQLIDDDDDEVVKPVPAIPPQVIVPPRGSPVRRGGRGRGGGRRGRGGGRAGAPVPGSGTTSFEIVSAEVASASDARGEAQGPTLAATSIVPTQPAGRKKPGPPKGSTQRIVRKKASKCVSSLSFHTLATIPFLRSNAKGTVNLLKDADAESVSESKHAPSYIVRCSDNRTISSIRRDSRIVPCPA